MRATAYRARLEAARDLMTFTCDACSSIGGLDLKFVLHHGEYILQSIAGHQELLGPDVNMAHLLMKNHVTDHIGRSAYALVTESAAAHLEVPLEHALPIDKRYEHYATIRAYILAPPFKSLGRASVGTRASGISRRRPTVWHGGSQRASKRSAAPRLG